MTSETHESERRDADDIARLIREGDGHYRQGRLAEADACFQQVLEHEPDNPEALHRRGLMALVRGEPEAAMELLRRVLSIRSDDASLCEHFANALMACGELDEAVWYWQRTIELDPCMAVAHGNLGNAYLAKGDLEAAEAAYRARIRLEPDNPWGFVGLARMLHKSDRAGEAKTALERALALGRGVPDVCHRVGAVLLEAGAPDAALELFERAVRDEPRDPQAHTSLGLALQMLSRASEAAQAFRRALSMDPQHPLALKHLGVLLQERGELEAAADCFRRLLVANPRDDVARHMLAATTGETTLTAPPAYVIKLFDDYADRFDAHLGEISYRVPDLLRNAVVALTGSDRLGWRVLDLGCGTGRCGEAVRSLATFLAGVDLSPRMIARSRQRRVYDSLVVASIDDALAAPEEPFDLIIAGDVFIYVGDLSDVFAGCARALRPDGLLAFSIEHVDGDGYRLCPTGRYAHSSAYVETVAAASRLSMVHRQNIVVREDPAPIPGQIIVLTRATGG